MPANPVPTDWWMILSDSHHRQVAIDLLGIGFFGGLFIVPLYAFVQRETPEDRRARVIAALNVFNALFMVVSAIMGILMLGVIGLTIPEFFLVLSIMNLVVAGFVYQQVPEFALRFIVWVLSHTIYRVRHENLHHIPGEGPVLLVCNHVTYMDALVIAGAIRRPVRFVMDYQIFRTPVLGAIFRLAKTIPIGSRNRVPEIYEAAFERIDEELAAGNVVCIFPEGRLTTDGEVATFRSGVDIILQRRPVPVVPMALRGLWGSFFSHCGGPALRHFPRRFWSRIELLADHPMPGAEVNAEILEEKVKKLRDDAR
jgi:1-acyl-sn-glycerol-3-phosphate acyltransferase